MKVVHIITGLARGGAERMLQDRIARTRHDVEVVALSVEGPIADELRESGTAVHFLGMRSNLDLRAVLVLARLLRQLAPDVVHVHLYRGMIYGRLAARLAGVRAIVSTEHSALEHSTEGRPATRGVRAMYRASERLGRLTIAVSSTTRDILVGHWSIPSDRIVVVPNGIDTRRLRITPDGRAVARRRYGFAPGQRVVVAAGRLVPGKRFDVLVEAVAQLDPTVHLLIAGEGPDSARLAALAEERGVTDRVHLVGAVDDIMSALSAGDAFASASLVETYGIAIIEAYVAGLPVVYVDCPALDDLVLGPDPRLAAAGDGPEVLASALETALDNTVGPEQVDDAWRQQVDVDQVNDRLDDLEQRVRTGPWWPVSPSRPDPGVAGTAP